MPKICTGRFDKKFQQFTYVQKITLRLLRKKIGNLRLKVVKMGKKSGHNFDPRFRHFFPAVHLRDLQEDVRQGEERSRPPDRLSRDGDVRDLRQGGQRGQHQETRVGTLPGNPH
jgi:hypothetical protein